jgi:hypothetical protein
MERDLEVLLSEKPVELDNPSHRHNRRRYRDPNAQPVKWMKLIQWWLVHRVPIDMIITPQIEAAACARFKIPEWKWEEAKKRFPSLLLTVNQTLCIVLEALNILRNSFDPKRHRSGINPI